MTCQDEFMLQIVAWRENRGGGLIGMQSVVNVVLNRCARNNTTPYQECVKRLQFSSITAPGNPELTLWPALTDPQWGQAQSLVAQAAAGTLADITGGATLYYAPDSIVTNATFTLPNGSIIPFPQGWNPAVVTYTVAIQGQVFFRD